jgi:3-deoxy-D-manno-octulosonate 8-phosphate phosphatase KdsC-like HAD superfamily phosphatase
MEKQYQGWSILVDCDGCLTNGQKQVNEKGERVSISFHARDSVACKMLVEMGFQVIVLTHSNFTGIDCYWMKYGAKVCTVTGGDAMTNKLAVDSFVSTPIEWEKTIGIGDDITDLCYLEKCKYAFCTADAHSLLKGGVLLNEIDSKLFALKQLRINGGNGVLSEILYSIQTNEIDANN